MLPRKGEPNIYPGVLGMAQAVIVTSDSVNMASEAAITGKPVMIAAQGNRAAESGLHDAMFAARHTAALAGDAAGPSNGSTRWTVTAGPAWPLSKNSSFFITISEKSSGRNE